jgi:hypothetical protein
MAKVDPLNETSEITFARSAPPHPNPLPHADVVEREFFGC